MTEPANPEPSPPPTPSPSPRRYDASKTPALAAVHAFDLRGLLLEWEARGVPFLEFLRRPTLSAGMFVIPADGESLDLPGRGDVLYVFLSGTAALSVGDKTVTVAPGSVVFVAEGATRRLADVREDVAALVIAPIPAGSPGP
ncbi:MAG: hypothetical protein ACYDDF_06405 [Thermoplasmatota archaeon]